VVNGTVATSLGSYAVVRDGAVDIFVYNVDVPTINIQNATVSIQLANIKNVPQYVTLTRIDDTHGNAPAAWQSMGSPMYPTRQQIDTLYRASAIQPERLAVKRVGDTTAQFDLSIPKWGVAVITVEM
jgi:beta-xylosidase